MHWLRSAISLRGSSPHTWRLRRGAARSRRRSRPRCRRSRHRRLRGRRRPRSRGARPGHRDLSPSRRAHLSPGPGAGGHPPLLRRPPKARQRRVTLHRPRPEERRLRPPRGPFQVVARGTARPAARGLERAGAVALLPAAPQWFGGTGGGEGQGCINPPEPLLRFPGAGEGQGSAARTPGLPHRTRGAVQGQGMGHERGRPPQDPTRTMSQYVQQWAAPGIAPGRPAERPSASPAAGAPARGADIGGWPTRGAPPAGLAPPAAGDPWVPRGSQHRMREASRICSNRSSWASSTARTGRATPRARAGRRR